MTTFQEPALAHAKFVAWTPPERMEGPEGEAITAGSQTIVEYFKGIKIAEIQDGGHKNHKKNLDVSDIRTVRVVFDQESVGLDHPIAGNIAPHDAGMEKIREAHENGGSVNIAIENVRKEKNSDGDFLSALSPIFQLRGADSPGGKGDMSVAGKNTLNVISAVNGETTVECRSDATQWSSLVKNKAGMLPPEGFRVVKDDDDWTKYAVIVPTGESAPQQSSQGSSVNSEQLAQVINDALDRKLGESSSDEGGRYAPSPSSKEIGEGPPFYLTTSRGHTSIGSYAASASRQTYRWAHEHLGAGKNHVAESSNLAGKIFSLALELQVQAYHEQSTPVSYKPNPNLNSFRECLYWLMFVIENHYPVTDGVDNWAHEEEAFKDALNQVLLTVQQIDEFLESNKNDSQQTPANQSSQSTPDNSAQKQSEPAKQSSNDKIERLQKCLNALNSKWDDYKAVHAIYKQANKEELLNAPVSFKDNVVVFDRNGGKKLQEVIIARGTELGKAQKQVSEPEPDNSPAPNEESPLPEEPASEEEQVSADEFASMTDGVVSESQESSNESPWGERLSQVTTNAEASKLYSEASASLKDEVEFDGDKMPLNEAFQKLKEKFETAQSYADEAYNANTVPELSAIRSKGKNEGLLNFEVNDGHSDDPVSLIDMLTARRGMISS